MYNTMKQTCDAKTKRRFTFCMENQATIGKVQVLRMGHMWREVKQKQWDGGIRTVHDAQVHYLCVGHFASSLSV